MRSGEQEILLIHNSHIKACGQPPKLTLKQGKWTCYFENHHGEQFIMQFEPDTNTCRLWSGDVGWEEELRVEEFRGRVLVLFARTAAERAHKFKMNKQFEWLESLSTDRDPIPLKKAIYKVLRSEFGKPVLTESECEHVANCPFLTGPEMEVIRAYWGICKMLHA